MADAVTFEEASPVEHATITDDELTALALAADPDIDLGDDAVCLWDLIGDQAGNDTGGRSVLPEWYMPAPMAGARPRRRRWHRRVALLVILSFLVIDGCGLCITYGQLVVA